MLLLGRWAQCILKGLLALYGLGSHTNSIHTTVQLKNSESFGTNICHLRVLKNVRKTFLKKIHLFRLSPSTPRCG